MSQVGQPLPYLFLPHLFCVGAVTVVSQEVLTLGAILNLEVTAK